MTFVFQRQRGKTEGDVRLSALGLSRAQDAPRDDDDEHDDSVSSSDSYSYLTNSSSSASAATDPNPRTGVRVVKRSTVSGLALEDSDSRPSVSSAVSVQRALACGTMPHHAVSCVSVGWLAQDDDESPMPRARSRTHQALSNYG
jgi:hypothetical protein